MNIWGREYIRRKKFKKDLDSLEKITGWMLMKIHANLFTLGNKNQMLETK